MTYIVGEIRLFARATVPDDYLECDGRSVAIATYPALYAVIGTSFGPSDGTNFTLPDFRGRLPIMCGQGVGIGNYTLGQSGGSTSQAVTISQMPQHSHSFNAADVNATQSTPPDGTALLAKARVSSGPPANRGRPAYAANDGTSVVSLNADALAQAGVPDVTLSNMQPSQVFKVGIFWNYGVPPQGTDAREP
ncbi:MAG: hypothetical protein EP335_16925 [Alphaproteobacteria bacterium]|nr:MAG: hypothetical protein EP335_16925 [Alphaproteobacteria bacterium]